MTNPHLSSVQALPPVLPPLVIPPLVSELLAQMTLSEKIGQLHQLAQPTTADMELVQAGRVGSFIVANSATAGNDQQEAVDAHELNEVQRVAVEQSRLGIPLLFARDVIHGFRNVAPIPLAQAATWSPDLAQQAAQDAAHEARSNGIHWVFTPMLDIARDPRWGRVAEGFGEDPYLAAAFARATIRGYQGDNPEELSRVAACAKHFVGYGASEGGRDYNSLEITPYTLHNIYLPPFRAAVQAGVASVMSSFGDYNGLPVTASTALLRDILRTQLGFYGVVVTDWEGSLELTRHGVAADLAQAARLTLDAGNDIDMMSGAYHAHLAEILAPLPKQAISEQAIPHVRAAIEQHLNDAVARVLTLKYRLGLFRQPYANTQLSTAQKYPPQHRETSLELARRSVILLKNQEEVLPLTTGLRVGVVGPAALWREHLFGTWTLDGQAQDVTTLLEALREHLGAAELWHTLNLDEAQDWGRRADVVIVALGETPTRSGEDHSVADITLPAGQVEGVRALHEVLMELNVPLVSVVFGGRPLVLTEVLRYSRAMLLAWHPGVNGGQAVAEVISGQVNPSGRLPVSLPRHTGQIPVHYNHRRTGRPTTQLPGAYRLSDLTDSPLFPFGFGLGYNPSELSDLEVSQQGPQHFEVSCLVRNPGQRSGVTVVQLYLQDVVASRTRPVRELAGFVRLELEAGKQQRVKLLLGPDQLGFYDEQGEFRLEAGEFKVWLGLDSQTQLEGSLKLEA